MVTILDMQRCTNFNSCKLTFYEYFHTCTSQKSIMPERGESTIWHVRRQIYRRPRIKKKNSKDTELYPYIPCLKKKGIFLRLQVFKKHNQINPDTIRNSPLFFHGIPFSKEKRSSKTNKTPLAEKRSWTSACMWLHNHNVSNGPISWGSIYFILYFCPIWLL